MYSALRCVSELMTALMTCWCFLQNSFDKQYCSLSLEAITEGIVKDKILRAATDTLVHLAGFTDQTVSLDLLESVARTRYCLQVVTELLQLHANQQGDTQFLYGHVVHRLLEETRYMLDYFHQLFLFH